MSVTGLLPCRLNNPNSFIFFPRSCFPNLWSFSLPSPWMPSSWLLTMLCPKLDVEPFPTLSGVDRLFRAFSLHTSKQRLFRGAGMGKLYSLYDSHSLRSTIPFSLRCAVLRTQIRPRRSWDGALLHRHSRWSCRVTSSRVGAEAGRGGKEKLPAQQSTGSPAPRGQESRTCCRLVFSGGLGTSCDF